MSKKTLLVDESANKVLSRFVSVFRSKSPTQIKNTAVDGTPHIQTIGEPEKVMAVRAFIKPNDVEPLDTAWAMTSLVSVTIGKIKHYGYITDRQYGERMAQGWREANITISEVDVQ